MPLTAVYGLRYPALSDDPNVPEDLQHLAEDVETQIFRLDARRPRRLPQAFLTTDYTTTTSEADLAGASLTFTTNGPNAIAEVHAVYECRAITAGFGYIRCRMTIDGVTHTREVLFTAPSVETRATVNLDLDITLASAGSHTIQLRALKTIAAGNAAIVGGSTGATNISITLYDS